MCYIFSRESSHIKKGFFHSALNNVFGCIMAYVQLIIKIAFEQNTLNFYKTPILLCNYGNWNVIIPGTIKELDQRKAIKNMARKTETVSKIHFILLFLGVMLYSKPQCCYGKKTTRKSTLDNWIFPKCWLRDLFSLDNYMFIHYGHLSVQRIGIDIYTLLILCIK